MTVAGCKSGESPPSGTGGVAAAPSASPKPESGAAPKASPALSAGLAAPVATAAHVAPELVQAQVNPGKKPAFSGPTGSVRGRIVGTGDAAPVASAVTKQIPKDCLGALETFGHLFREGMNRSLADVLVAVTGYEGYVPPRGESYLVEARGCAWSTRTVALTFGQRIDVVSKDQGTYVPELLGQYMPAQLFVTPGGPNVELHPQKPGQYVLVDSVRLFNAAEVYVLRYSTFDVTGLDGLYEISGIPAGKAQISALLPITQGLAQKEITIEAGKTLTLDLEIPFDKKKYEEKLAADKARAAQAPSRAAPSAPAPAAPSPATSK